MQRVPLGAAHLTGQEELAALAPVHAPVQQHHGAQRHGGQEVDAELRRHHHPRGVQGARPQRGVDDAGDGTAVREAGGPLEVRPRLAEAERAAAGAVQEGDVLEAGALRVQVAHEEPRPPALPHRWEVVEDVAVGGDAAPGAVGGAAQEALVELPHRTAPAPVGQRQVLGGRTPRAGCGSLAPGPSPCPQRPGHDPAAPPQPHGAGNDVTAAEGDPALTSQGCGGDVSPAQGELPAAPEVKGQRGARCPLTP